MAASRSRQSIWRLGRSSRASPGLIGVFRRFKQDGVTADYVFCSNLPSMLRVEQRRSPSTHRKKSTLTLFTPIIATTALLYGHGSYAAQKVIEWLDDIQCSNSIRFDPKKYDEQTLRNTISVIFASRYTGNPFPFIPADVPVHPSSPASARIEQYQQLCERTIRQSSDLALIDLPGIEAYRKLKLEALEDECRFGAIQIRAAAGNPSALRDFTPSVAKCSRFIDALEGKVDIVTFWHEMVNSTCQYNASPSVCRADFLSHERNGDAMDWVRHDVLLYGWTTCSTSYLKVTINRKRMEEMQAALATEFARQFKIRRPPCSD